MYLRIEAFTQKSGSEIPKNYSCDGKEMSPGMAWEDVPEGTQSFVVVMENIDYPDRSTPYLLWMVYDISGDVRSIETDSIPEGSTVGVNDRGAIGYSGPCPKPGAKPSRYAVQLYALDCKLDLPVGASKQDLAAAMKGHILDETEVVGFYERNK